MNAVVDNNVKGSKLSFENEEEFGRRIRNLRSTYGSKERPISLDSSDDDDDDDDTSSDGSLIEVVKSPRKKRLSSNGGDNDKIVKAQFDVVRNDNPMRSRTDDLLDLNSLSGQHPSEEEVKRKYSFHNLNALKPNPEFDLLKRRSKFDTCCIQCLKSKRDIYCDRFKRCNICRAKKKKCQFSLIAKIDHSFDNLNVNDIKSKVITNFMKSNSLLIEKNKSLSPLIQEHNTENKDVIINNSTEGLSLNKKNDDFEEKMREPKEHVSQINFEEAEKKKKKKKKKKKRKESDEILVTEKKKREKYDEVLVSDKKKKKKKKRKRESEDIYLLEKNKKEHTAPEKKKFEDGALSPKRKEFDDIALFAKTNIITNDTLVSGKKKPDVELIAEMKSKKNVDLKSVNPIDNSFGKSHKEKKGGGIKDSLECEKASLNFHNGNSANTKNQVLTINKSKALSKENQKSLNPNSIVVDLIAKKDLLNSGTNSKSNVLKAEPKSLKNVLSSPLKSDKIVINIKDLNNDLSGISCSDTSESSDSSEDHEKADDEFSDNENARDTKKVQILSPSLEMESPKSRDLIYSQRVMAQLERLDFESRDIYALFDNTGPRRKRRRATKQDYKLHDDSDYENNVYDNNGEVILSEEEQDKRLLNGQVDDEFLANIEEPMVGPTAINQSSEDEFSD